MHCLSALGQGVPQTGYKKTITTAGSSCHLEGFTQEWLHHDKGKHIHPFACLYKQIQPQVPSYTLDIYISVYNHYSTHLRQHPCPQSFYFLPHSSGVTGHFVTRQHRISPPKYQSSTPHRHRTWTHTLLAGDQPLQTSQPVCLACNSLKLIPWPCAARVRIVRCVKMSLREMTFSTFCL